MRVSLYGLKRAHCLAPNRIAILSTSTKSLVFYPTFISDSTVGSSVGKGFPAGNKQSWPCGDSFQRHVLVKRVGVRGGPGGRRGGGG